MEGETAILGRSSDCHVVIDRADISRRHVEIRRGLVVEDLASRNGTHVDGARIVRATALGQARFEIGDAGSKNVIVVEVLGEPESRREPPPDLLKSSVDLGRPPAAAPAAQGPAAVSGSPRSPASVEAELPALTRLRKELSDEVERYRTQCSRMEQELGELRRQMDALGKTPAAARGPSVPQDSPAADPDEPGALGRALAEERALNLRLAQRVAELERGRSG